MFEIKVKEDKINSKVLQVQLKGKERELLEFSDTYYLVVNHSGTNEVSYDESALVRFLKTLSSKDDKFIVHPNISPTQGGIVYMDITYTVICNGIVVFYDLVQLRPPVRNTYYISVEDFTSFLGEVKGLVESMEKAIKEWDITTTYTETEYEI